MTATTGAPGAGASYRTQTSKSHPSLSSAALPVAHSRSLGRVVRETIAKASARVAAPIATPNRTSEPRISGTVPSRIGR